MSFTVRVKEELLSLKRFEKSELAAIIKMSGSLGISMGGLTLSVTTENAKIARHIYELLHHFYEAKSDIRHHQKTNLKKNRVYTVFLDEKVEEICASVNAEGEVCVPANYNCPGQIVISGSVPGIEKACELMKAAGAKRALPLKVGGAFHSPLMDPAKVELEAAINATEIHTPKCPVYQNVDALPHTDPAEIKKNLVAQLTASVRWTQSVKNMVADGATDFTECGPGAVLQGLIKKIDGTVSAHGIA